MLKIKVTYHCLMNGEQKEEDLDVDYTSPTRILTLLGEKINKDPSNLIVDGWHAR